MSLGKKLLLIVLLQSLVLAAMIAKRQYSLNTGTQVVLETQPIDPRSLFRGDYVRLNYTISSLRLDELGGDDEFRRHDTLYLRLRPGEPYWQPVAVYHRPPQPAPEEVVLRGEVQYSRGQMWNPQTRESELVRNLRVRYGIENYFVPEGEGRRLERPTEGEEIALRVAVDRYANAAISAVLVNGEEVYRETLF